MLDFLASVSGSSSFGEDRIYASLKLSTDFAALYTTLPPSIHLRHDFGYRYSSGMDVLEATLAAGCCSLATLGEQGDGFFGATAWPGDGAVRAVHGKV